MLRPFSVAVSHPDLTAVDVNTDNAGPNRWSRVCGYSRDVPFLSRSPLTSIVQQDSNLIVPFMVKARNFAQLFCIH